LLCKFLGCTRTEYASNFRSPALNGCIPSVERAYAILKRPSSVVKLFFGGPYPVVPTNQALKTSGTEFYSFFLQVPVKPWIQRDIRYPTQISNSPQRQLALSTEKRSPVVHITIWVTGRPSLGARNRTNNVQKTTRF